MCKDFFVALTTCNDEDVNFYSGRKLKKNGRKIVYESLQWVSEENAWKNDAKHDGK